MYEVSDLIGKFIEDQEQQLWTVADSTKSSSLLSKEFKFHTSNSSISFVTIHQQEMTRTTKRPLDQVDSDAETLSSSKKTSINTKTSSTEVTATVV